VGENSNVSRRIWSFGNGQDDPLKMIRGSQLLDLLNSESGHRFSGSQIAH
jgi:hypothetical protein